MEMALLTGAEARVTHGLDHSAVGIERGGTEPCAGLGSFGADARSSR